MWRYRLHVVALAAAVLLTLTVYRTLEIWLRAKVEWATLDARNLEMAQRLALAVDGELIAELSALRILSLSHTLDNDDLAAFYNLARRSHFENGLWHSVILVDPSNNRIFLNTTTPFGSPLTFCNDPEAIQEVAATRGPVIGGPLEAGRNVVEYDENVDGMPYFFDLRVPVVRDDRLRYVLGVAMSPNRLRALLYDVMPPGLGGASALLDAEGRIILQTIEPEHVGEWAPKESRAALPGQVGTYQMTIGDKRAVVAFATAPVSKWSVHLGVPAEEYEGPFRSSSRLVIGGCIVSLGLGLILAFTVLLLVARQRRAERATQEARHMEAVGRLVAAIAHDFNNLLTVTIGNIGRAQDYVTDADPRITNALAAALKGAERGEKLTRQLLSFGSQQRLSPQSVDLNNLLSEMKDLIQTSLGETIQLRFKPSPSKCPTVIDRSEMELVVLNLVINARDAMPNGGLLTIGTKCVALQSHQRVNGLPAGRYALLIVTDSGKGMTDEVKHRAFEPFFTTKPTGQGTGLGLSQAYGFVQQSGGTIRLISEVGKGTSVEIWLPEERKH